jgi:hypothetical protein
VALDVCAVLARPCTFTVFVEWARDLTFAVRDRIVWPRRSQ